MDQDFLARVFPFWGKLLPEEREYFLAHTVERTYEKGAHVYQGLQGCTGVIAVRSGQLRVYLLSDEGKEITLYRLIEGDVCLLSASCILKNISFNSYIDAEVGTEVTLTQPEAYDRLRSRNPEVETYTGGMIAGRFSEAMWVMEQVVFMKFDRRLAIFLLEQLALEGSDTVTLTHEQIAKHLGSAREVVTRMLKYFQSEGIVSVSRGGIKVLDEKRLYALS